MLAPDDRIGPFFVIRPLGRGGTSTVYAVKHRVLGTEHALKLVDDRALARRVHIEAELRQRVSSPHVLLPSAVIDRSGLLGLVMPLVRGCTLKELMEVRRLDLDEVLGLAVGLAEGLAAVHRAGVVHRDLKPANVLLDPASGRIVPRISDFGIARLEGSDDTDAGTMLGTLAYAAPEQQRDAATVDARADLWSLGVLLHEMATGRRPPTPGTLSNDVPEALRGLLRWLVEIDPARRCPSAAEVRERLGNAPSSSLGTHTSLGETVERLFVLVDQTTAPRPTLDDIPRPAPPLERDRFFGREDDLARLQRAVAQRSIVTVTGFGGVGKTRLVVHFLRGEGSVTEPYWADVSEARDEAGIVAAVARSLGMAQERRVDPTQVGFAIGQRGRCLVVIDNAEGVTDPLGPLLSAWTEAAPRATFVVTSRVPTGLADEQCLPLDPLAVEDGVSLFVDRARRVDDRFEVDAAQQEVLVELVEALDAVPLAVELAAARVRTLRLEAIRDRLSERFQLLRSTQARPPRQATLRATLDWSWELLEADAQRALSWLAAFRGGWSFESFETVIDVGTEPLGVLERLVQHSMVRTTSDGRFDLLHTVRAYAAEQLDARAERETAESRHGACYAAIAEALSHQADLHHPGAIAVLDREVENLVTACRRAADRDDPRTAVTTLQGAWFALRRQGRSELAVTLADHVAARCHLSPDQERSLRAVAGAALRVQGRLVEARTALERAVQLSGAAAPRDEVAIRLDLGDILVELGARDEAGDTLDAARNRAAAAGDAR